MDIIHSPLSFPPELNLAVTLEEPRNHSSGSLRQNQERKRIKRLRFYQFS